MLDEVCDDSIENFSSHTSSSIREPATCFSSLGPGSAAGLIKERKGGRWRKKSGSEASRAGAPFSFFLLITPLRNLVPGYCFSNTDRCVLALLAQNQEERSEN